MTSNHHALYEDVYKRQFLNNSLTDNQKALMLHRAREGWYKIIYVAPERLELSLIHICGPWSSGSGSRSFSCPTS